MHRFLPLVFVVVAVIALGGCGPYASPKPTPTPAPKVTPTPVATPAETVAPAEIIFGKSLSGSTIREQGTSFANPAKLVWKAQLPRAPGAARSLTIRVRRINGGDGVFPRPIWSSTVTRGNTSAVEGQMSRSQMAARRIKSGGKFELAYLSGNRVLASGEFSIGSDSGGPPGGY